jgi:hypothetical protein
VFVVGDRFRPGPWNLGRASVPIGVVGLGFVSMMVPILCLPSVVGENLDAASMNWTVVVYGGPMVGVLVWWGVDARRWFRGPRVNVEHLMGREVDLEGVDGEGVVGVKAKGGASSVLSVEDGGGAQVGDSKIGGL